MVDDFEKIKRLKAFEEIFVTFTNNKMVFKDLNKPDEHYTMSVEKDGIVDFHKKVESTNDYESLAKIDFSGILQKINSDPQNFISNLIGQLFTKVSFDEDEFAHYMVSNIATKEELSEFVEKKKRTHIIPIDAIKKLNLEKRMFSWKDAKDKVKSNAVVFDKNEQVGSIMEKNGKFYFMKLDSLENSSFAELIKDKTLYDGTSLDHSSQ